jgi:hypothetical protein
MQPVHVSTGRRADSRFYGWAAGLAAAIIFAGFARTFYLKSLFPGAPLSGLLMLHGVVMSAWLALLLAQVMLVASGRTDLHRRLGMAGFGLALVVVGVCIAAAVDAARRGASPAPGVTPLMFLAVPMADAVVFTLLAGTGLALRRRPDFHKRLMLLATLAILAPGIARIPVSAVHDGGLPVIFGLTVALVLLAVVVDTVRHRRLHPAFGWGGALVVLSVPARIMLAGTPAWTSFAQRLIA